MSNGTAIEVKGIRGEPGKTVRGFVKIGETPMGPIRFPVVIVTGTRPGATLCLTAGVHATEYPGIDAVLRTVSATDPQTLRGTLIAVPVVNQIMFQTRTGFINPVDGLNLNRTAPGLADGTISQVLAHTLLTEVIAQADAHIDCHGGDLGEELWPYAGYVLTGDAEQDRKGEAMVRLYTPRIFALYENDTPLPATGGSVTATASRQGTVSILAEAGSDGTLRSADTEHHLRGIRNVMRYLDMIDGDPQLAPDPLRARGQFVVSARRGGLVRLTVEIGQDLAAGHKVADIVDVFGDVIEEIVVPEAGIARLIWTHKAINTGDPVVKCWRAGPAEPFTL